MRDKILRAGLPVMFRSGYHRASVRGICAAAGAPQGSFTNHFRSKEAFAVEVLDQYFDYLQGLVSEALNHETLTPRTDIPKLQHVEELAEQRKLYGENGGSGGSSVLSMRMFDFGNVVIMEAFQGRNPSAKPTSWNLRLFLNRGDGWKIALSAQTSIT